ncbi:MAG: hypothetical protein ACKODX_21890 [Gemmata sp.]
MAKSKETSVPLIFALVFFVLATIAFGVMWYLSFSDMETHVAARKKAEADLAGLRGERDEAVRLARVYRIYLGIPHTAEGDNDNTIIDTEAKAGDKIAGEVKAINETVAAKIKEVSITNVPEDQFTFWKLDASGKVEKAPTFGLVNQFAKLKNMDAAYKAAEDERDNYKKQVATIAASVQALKAATDEFKTETGKLPDKIKKQIDDVVAAFDVRTKKYEAAEATANKTISDVKEERDRYERELRKATTRIAELQADNQRLTVEATKTAEVSSNFEEPQGKILRKVPGSDGVVELNIGSALGVRPGLTFTVLPTDFPEKGRQSRMRMLRVPDGKGAYKSVETFVPKGSIEVFEVVNERLSLARVQPGSELDPIRDGIAQGDLLYNSVWRKGVADHVALVGIFDVNGDGADDIESVVKDLLKMGIPVDAYYDMKKRAWVGQVTERTRYIVEGYYPLNSVNDPNRDEKTKLLASMTAAINEGKQKGVTSINFRDFFSRMGYKFRLDVTDDKVNQATAPYLSNVGVGASPIPAPGNP